MALLRAKTRAEKGRLGTGSFAAKYVFILLAVCVTLSPVLLRKLFSPRFTDEPMQGDFDDGDEEPSGLGSILSDASNLHFSIDDELLKLDQQLKTMEQQRIAEEAEAGAAATSEAEGLRGNSNSTATDGGHISDGWGHGAANEFGDSSDFDKRLRINDAKDIQQGWEMFVNEAIAKIDVCEETCASCALSIAASNNKVDADLLTSGELTVIGGISTKQEWDLKLDAMQRDILRCTSRYDQNWEERQLRKRMNDIKLKQFEDSMRDVKRREKQAAKYELLRQELMANMEREEEEKKKLHDIADPIWYDMNTLRDTALTVCTEKASQIMRSKHHRTELYTPTVLKETQVLVRSCVRDFAVSRGKAKLSAEKLEISAERRKKGDFDAAAVTPKHVLQLQRIAGIEADAMDEIQDVRNDAMHTTFADLRKAMIGEHRISSLKDGNKLAKSESNTKKRTKSPTASAAKHPHV
mmetsp:Transcript_2946/g.8302  ORF Transcript_2946/g.8302 Transcript_2946/m.8302 type:complete len:467 (+) Transcript_2946:154-1554(+)